LNSECSQKATLVKPEGADQIPIGKHLLPQIFR
jgi:hypothetical protein